MILRSTKFKNQKNLGSSTSKVWIVAIIVLAIAILGWIWRGVIVSWVQERPYHTSLPPAQPAKTVEKDEEVFTTSLDLSDNKGSMGGFILAEDTNLAVPFAPQAPHANWDQPYQDACEEAAVIMVERFYRGAALSLDDMDAEILRMVEFQNSRYGFFKDSNIAETVQLAEDFYPSLSAQAVYGVAADDIRAALAQGIPVVVLADGRKLGNPFYTQPGPDKHALVIKGVKGESFITNDPGTRRGKDFVYPIETVMNAIVDYDGNTPGTHTRAMILITSRER